MKGFHINIEKATKENANFRQVLFTGLKSQLVVMSIAPHSEIGEEVHEHVEQTLCFLEGKGVAVLDHVEYQVGPGDVVVVPPGTRHNFINTEDTPLKLYTVYAPPNHIDGRMHATIEDAEKDTDDEAIGHAYTS
jgi:mannose-6-phosphate isomerase-like protein (cupin superfamily)